MRNSGVLYFTVSVLYISRYKDPVSELSPDGGVLGDPQDRSWVDLFLLTRSPHLKFHKDCNPVQSRICLPALRVAGECRWPFLIDPLHYHRPFVKQLLRPSLSQYERRLNLDLKKVVDGRCRGAHSVATPSTIVGPQFLSEMGRTACTVPGQHFHHVIEQSADPVDLPRRCPRLMGR